MKRVRENTRDKVKEREREKERAEWREIDREKLCLIYLTYRQLEWTS